MCHKNLNVYFVFLFTKIKNFFRKLQHMLKLSSFNFDTLKIAFDIGFYHSPQKRKVLTDDREFMMDRILQFVD